MNRTCGNGNLSYDCNDGDPCSPNKSHPQCTFPDLFLPANPYCSDANRLFCRDRYDPKANRNAAKLQCTENWKPYVDDTYADYAIGGPTINMWVESWNAKHSSDVILYANGSGGDGYCVGTEANTASSTQVLSSYEGYNDTLFFPNKTPHVELQYGAETDGCGGYWLSSSSAEEWRVYDAGCVVHRCN